MRTHQCNTIPKLTGTYAALARGLTAQSAFLALSANARLALMVVERELPACGAGDLAPPLLGAKTGLPDDQVTDALTELEDAGWLLHADGYAIMPHVLDMVQGKARGRVIYEVRQLPEAVQATLRERHRWVMGRRTKDVENPDASRPRVTGAGERNTARNKPTNQPTNRDAAAEPTGVAPSARRRAREPDGMTAAECDRVRQQQHRWIERQRKTP